MWKTATNQRSQTFPTHDARLRLATVDLVCWEWMGTTQAKCELNTSASWLQHLHLLSLACLLDVLIFLQLSCNKKQLERVAVPDCGNRSCSALCSLYIASFQRVANLQHNGAEIAAGVFTRYLRSRMVKVHYFFLVVARNQWNFLTSPSRSTPKTEPVGMCLSNPVTVTPTDNFKYSLGEFS